MAIRVWHLLVAMAGAGACASSPRGSGPPAPAVTPVRISGSRGVIGSVAIRNEPRVVARTVPVSLDSLWRALPTVYDILGIPEARGDSSRQAYGNPEFRPRRIDGARLSRFIDCGSGVTAVPRADEYDVTMSVLTRLTRAEGGGTVIATTVDATAKPRAESGNPVHCPSTGTLEARIVDRALRVLSGEQ